MMHLSWNNCVLLVDFERLHKYTSVITRSSTRHNRQNSTLFTDAKLVMPVKVGKQNVRAAAREPQPFPLCQSSGL